MFCTFILTKAVKWNKMPFGKDICVTSSGVVLNRSSDPLAKTKYLDFGVGTSNKCLSSKLRPNQHATECHMRLAH